MGSSTMFGVTKGSAWYSFVVNDWFDVMNAGCLTSNQYMAEELATKVGGKVTIIQIVISCMYDPNQRKHM